MGSSRQDWKSIDFYNPRFVAALFDEMSRTYGTVNVLSSFGFCRRWRRQCADQIEIRTDDHVVDLMSGMGELWPYLVRHMGNTGRITAIDLSSAMCAQAREHRARQQIVRADLRIDILQEDALQSIVESESADVVISSFGLKTFSRAQQQILAEEIYRILRPGGRFCLLEISTPSSSLLRLPYMFYLRHVIPLIGLVFLGNPDNYRWLGRYTEAFRDCSAFQHICTNIGFISEQRSFFFGCASAVAGMRPE